MLQSFMSIKSPLLLYVRYNIVYNIHLKAIAG